MSGVIVAGVGQIEDDVIDIALALSSALDNSIYSTLSNANSAVSLITNEHDFSIKLIG